MNSKDQKRILVTGSKGQVGVELARQLPTTFPSAEILMTDRTSLDLSNLTQLKETISQFSPHIIINAGAYTAVDKAEDDQETAYIINSEAPKVLAKISKSTDALLIHYSTDYVFDGMKKEFYKEEDITNPLNIYGKSKLKGEQNIVSIGGRFLILRTSWVYAEHGHNFMRTILRLAQERNELSIVNDQWGSPTSASWLAEISNLLSQRFFSKHPLESGIYHAVCREETNWFDYAHFILECANIDNVSLIPTATGVTPTKAKRPTNSRLSTDKIQSKLGILPPPWKNEVQRIVSLILKETE
ncbi:MAG: dTDP-4-dehydrorhamnose reductase [Proteobacteria bacterium]|nr:dTDP-4-dehydrorhamnose reductase [Pseudomonadota bacterium]